MLTKYTLSVCSLVNINLSQLIPVLNGARDVCALAGGGLHVGRVRDLVVDGDSRRAGQGAPPDHRLEAAL